MFKWLISTSNLKINLFKFNFNVLMKLFFFKFFYHFKSILLVF